MVHISLPHRHKDKSKQVAGDLQPEQHAEQRPSPGRSPNSQSAVANGGEKPLILKIYVIRVGCALDSEMSMCIDLCDRLETLRQKTSQEQATR